MVKSRILEKKLKLSKYKKGELIELILRIEDERDYYSRKLENSQYREKIILEQLEYYQGIREKI